jgi:hypothetical protein
MRARLQEWPGYSAGTYDVYVSFNGDSSDPDMAICTEDVDLTSSVDDTFTVPVTVLTVDAEDSNGNQEHGPRLS